jgi:hypothetical protein
VPRRFERRRSTPEHDEVDPDEHYDAAMTGSYSVQELGASTGRGEWLIGMLAAAFMLRRRAR